MKKKYFSSSRLFYRMFSVNILLVAAFVFSACNDQGNKISSTDWVNLTIKFKPNSTAAIREAAMNTIEQFLVDTVRQLRGGDFKQFNPSFIRTKDPFKDSLIYTLSVGLRDNYGRSLPLQLASPTSAPPTCLCSTGCKICRLVLTESIVPMPSTPLLPLVDYIDSVNTTYEYGKDQSASGVSNEKNK
ncbi:MAG: hypothetical protein JWM28_1560 [Chitinophagaceae bacterium]|nr:hypothetical protein [Chitinophagaceae bacterium]